MKKFQLLIFMAIFIVLLAACSSGGTSSPESPSKTGGKESAGTETETGGGDSEEKENVTIRIAWWGSEPRHDYTMETIKLYEEQNSHVKIQAEYNSWDDYWKGLAPQAAANELPDIIQMDLSYFAQYAENNQLSDLTPYLGNQIDLSNYADNFISGGEMDGKLYGISTGVNAVGFQYDPEVLAKAGVDALAEDWTWDDYRDIAKKAKAADIFMDTGLKADVFFNYYLRTHGKKLYSDDGTSLGYDDDQLFVDFFTILAESVEQGSTPTPDYLVQLKGIEDSPVVTGGAIGVWQWSNQFVGLQQVADRPLEMHTMPGPGIKEGLFLKPSMFWSLTSNSKHPEEAAKFIDFLLNDLEANKLNLGDRGVPGSSIIKEELKPLLSPAQVQVFDYVEWVENNSSPFDGPDPVGAGQVIDLIDNLSEQMAYGQLSPEDAAKEFRQQADSILSQNQ